MKTILFLILSCAYLYSQQYTSYAFTKMDISIDAPSTCTVIKENKKIAQLGEENFMIVIQKLNSKDTSSAFIKKYFMSLIDKNNYKVANLNFYQNEFNFWGYATRSLNDEKNYLLFLFLNKLNFKQQFLIQIYYDGMLTAEDALRVTNTMKEL